MAGDEIQEPFMRNARIVKIFTVGALCIFVLILGVSCVERGPVTIIFTGDIAGEVGPVG
jgi:hypothetical protein